LGILNSQKVQFTINSVSNQLLNSQKVQFTINSVSNQLLNSQKVQFTINSVSNQLLNSQKVQFTINSVSNQHPSVILTMSQKIDNLQKPKSILLIFSIFSGKWKCKESTQIF
jgi:hypothetical protein